MGSSTKATNALNSRAISPVPTHITFSQLCNRCSSQSLIETIFLKKPKSFQIGKEEVKEEGIYLPL